VLSMCMIVKNEELVLGRCLDSVREVADEIVVVDTGSTDATIDIARSFGATVLHHDFTDMDFSAARNRALDAAHGDFALVLDADEALRADSQAEVRRLTAWPLPLGYVVNRYNLDAEGESVDHAVRLFPLRPDFRYRDRVHETVDASILEAGGRLRRSAIDIDHHLPGEDRQREKGRLYMSLLHRDLRADPDNVERLTFLAAEYHRQGDFPEATRVAERIAGLRPDDHEVHLTVALYHFAFGGDRGRARASVRSALRLVPNDPEATALWTAIQEAA
jgi:glycosyltransferase involved in cell wall biosynthesis